MDLVNILEANYPETVKNIVGTNSEFSHSYSANSSSTT